jgi:hypothetical protein
VNPLVHLRLLVEEAPGGIGIGEVVATYAAPTLATPLSRLDA